jgi:hypothetical protein
MKMSDTIKQPTTEEIAQHYKAAMDSVNLLNAGKPSDMDDKEWSDCVERNKGHLRIMLAKTFWTNQDLTPLQQASA